jgi:hypothetical protein
MRDDTGVALKHPNAVIEKDYSVTQVIHSLLGTETEYFH